MDRTNPLAEVTHKRHLSAEPTFSRERAGFEVHVHYTHYDACQWSLLKRTKQGLISSLCMSKM